MNGLMMQQPLLISSLLTHAERHHGEQEIVSRRVEGDVHRTTYRELATRSRRMANALAAMGVGFGDRVATVAWNGYRHMELYYAVSGSGAVLHTLNPRLHPDQVVWLADHAEDQVLFFDLSFLPLIEAIAERVKTIKAFVAMTDRAHMPAPNATSKVPNLLCYEELMPGASDEFDWPEFDENTAATLCYTGTAGDPKGALYSHRSTTLHTYATALPDTFNCSARDTILPVVPMFHVNAWGGLPYVGSMVGAKLVFPGPWLDGRSVHDLMESEGVTLAAGVPTIWQGLLSHVEANSLEFSTMRRTIIGGAACPSAMMRAFQDRYDVQVLHAWGMTEMSPLGTVCALKPGHLRLSPEQRMTVQAKQGRGVFGVDLSKDVIKSRGEWIGSNDLDTQSGQTLDSAPLARGGNVAPQRHRIPVADFSARTHSPKPTSGEYKLSRQTMPPRTRSGCAFAPSALAVAAALALLGSGVQAFELDTGNPDLAIRWDNNVRMNLASRVESRDPKIGNSAVSDEGTYGFDNGDWVAKRFDLLSEFDVVYKKRYGARISGTAWYDAAYGDTSRSNPNPPLTNIPSYINKQYSSTTKRLYHGGTGELMDAFVFGGVDLGEVPVQAKLGRHTIYWGESVLLGGHLHSVSYAQNPLDLQKGFATPGTEAKELFRPLNQLSMQAQVSDTLSLAGNAMFEWESARYPEGGTYLGPVDFVFNGPDRQFLSPALGFAARRPAHEPKQHGEFGLSARWSPAWLDGTLGFYYRNFADKLPQTLLTAVGPGVSGYNLIYADNIQMFGMSLGKNIGGVSIGAEVSQRRNTPLNSQVLGIAPGLPGQGDTKGPRGDTWHAVLNVLGTVAKTPMFDSATWLAELNYARWSKVRSGANLFNAEGFAPCLAAPAAGRPRNLDKWDGCTTKNYAGMGATFTPTWYQVFNGVDLSAPLTYSVGLYGNAPTVFGGNQGLGNYSVGLSADVQQKYRFDLKYIDFIGRYRDNGTAVTSQNGLTTFLKDRGFVSLTFKTTF